MTTLHNKERQRWLRSVLAVKSRGKHCVLGPYVKQEWGLSYIQPIKGREPQRCYRCGQRATRKGHDPCLADLPYVINACCGHGDNFAYATLRNGFCLVGKSLKVYLQKVGRLKQFQALAGERGWHLRMPGFLRAMGETEEWENFLRDVRHPPPPNDAPDARLG